MATALHEDGRRCRWLEQETVEAKGCEVAPVHSDFSVVGGWWRIGLRTEALATTRRRSSTAPGSFRWRKALSERLKAGRRGHR